MNNGLVLARWGLRISKKYWYRLGPPRWFSGNEPICQYRKYRRCRFNPWVWKIPWRRKWQPTQYSCLENLTDRGAWQAIVQGVKRSWTRLSNLACMHGHSSLPWFFFFNKEYIIFICITKKEEKLFFELGSFYIIFLTYAESFIFNHFWKYKGIHIYIIYMSYICI